MTLYISSLKFITYMNSLIYLHTGYINFMKTPDRIEKKLYSNITKDKLIDVEF